MLVSGPTIEETVANDARKTNSVRVFLEFEIASYHLRTFIGSTSSNGSGIFLAFFYHFGNCGRFKHTT